MTALMDDTEATTTAAAVMVTAPPVCRISLEEHLNQRRVSLTAHEFSFAKQVIQQGGESDVQTLAATLKDQDLFFGHLPHTDDESNAERDDHVASSSLSRFVSPAGSIKRQSRIEIRKSCSTQAALWKGATLKISSRDSVGRSSSVLISSQKAVQLFCRQSTFSAAANANATKSVIEDDTASWTFDSRTDDSETEEEDDEETSEDIDPSKETNRDHPCLLDEPASPPHRKLLTRTASMNLYGGQGIEVGEEELFDVNSTPHYDPWDEETDRAGHTFDFHILGTSHYDESVLPHVLSPPLMQTLQDSLPYSQRGESFWLKYSMVRDGASLTTLLRHVRASTNTLLAMETIDGQVFGAYCCCPWNIQPHFYGTGSSFVWRMNHSRMEMADSVWEQAKRETDLDIFPSRTQNPLVQLCQTQRLCVGSGTPMAMHTVSTGETYNPQDFGFAIALGESLLEVCSSACLSFDSPPLVNGGVPVELVNLEVWALTPFLSEEEARQMEYHRLFLKRNATF